MILDLNLDKDLSFRDRKRFKFEEKAKILSLVIEI